MNFRKKCFDEIENCAEELCNLANYLFLNPETAFKEINAHNHICDYLEKKKFKVQRNFIHETGFCAIHETKATPHFAILVEYDALPDIGHACGHNIIAQSSVAAAIGLKVAMDNGLKCKLTVLGTPAEEKGGGKLKFISEGIFNNIDLAMMCHPYKENCVECPSLAVIGYTITFIGKEAHASLAPWNGVNALDAAVLAFNAISCFRQQIPPDFRIHGIISKGGVAPNIIPNLTEMQYYIRAPTSKLLKEILPRFHNCFHGAANATGCQIILEELTPLYENILHNKILSKLFKKNATEMGLSFQEFISDALISTDAGNVSQVCPTLHPLFFIGSHANLHTTEFSNYAGKQEARMYGLLQGKIMVGTVIDIVMDESEDILLQIKLDFKKRKEA